MRRCDERGDRGDLERRAERREDPHSSVGARGDTGADAAPDLGGLPPAITSQSLSTASLILPLDAALQAVEHMARAGRCVDTWEGWVKLRDGGRARSLTHAGSFALPRDAERAAQLVREGMQRAQAHWERDPEYPGATLYFALTFGAIT